MYKPNFRHGRNGVPILSNEEIEQDAEKFILDYNFKLLACPDEVDIDDFSEFYLDLHPGFMYLTSYGGILGRMIFNDGSTIPVYRPEEKRAAYYKASRRDLLIDSSLEGDEHRIRSTMGHECGHWIYHQMYYSNQLSVFPGMGTMATACKKTDIEGRGRRRLVTDQDWLEHQANYFSAAILMPRRTMNMVCNDPGLRRHIYCNYPENPSEMLACHISEIFNVSEESARIRLQQLGLEYEKVEDPIMSFFIMSDSEEESLF